MKKNHRWIWIPVIAFLVIVAAQLVVAFVALAHAGWDVHDGFLAVLPFLGNWTMPFGSLLMGAFWIILIVSLLSGPSAPRTVVLTGTEKDHAVSRLKERLANGEIGVEEYDTLRAKIVE